MISVSGTKRFCHSISRLRQFSSLLQQPRNFRFCWQSQSRSGIATNSSSATHHVTSAPSPKIIGRDTNDPDPHAAPVFSIPPKQDWFKGLIGFGVGLGFTFMYLEWAGYYAHNPQELTEKFSRAAPSENDLKKLNGIINDLRIEVQNVGTRALSLEQTQLDVLAEAIQQKLVDPLLSSNKSKNDNRSDLHSVQDLLEKLDEAITEQIKESKHYRSAMIHALFQSDGRDDHQNDQLGGKAIILLKKLHDHSSTSDIPTEKSPATLAAEK